MRLPEGAHWQWPAALSKGEGDAGSVGGAVVLDRYSVAIGRGESCSEQHGLQGFSHHGSPLWFRQGGVGRRGSPLLRHPALERAAAHASTSRSRVMHTPGRSWWLEDARNSLRATAAMMSRNSTPAYSAAVRRSIW